MNEPRQPRGEQDQSFMRFMSQLVYADPRESGDPQADRIENATCMEDLSDADLLFVLSHLLGQRGLSMEREGNIVSLLRSRAASRAPSV